VAWRHPREQDDRPEIASEITQDLPVDGVRWTRKGNLAVVAEPGTCLTTLVSKIRERTDDWRLDHMPSGIFLDGPWDEVVVHGVLWTPNTQEDITTAITTISARCPNTGTPTLQRVTPLVPA
jgi:hypothetical protein